MIDSICSQENIQLLFYTEPIQDVRKPEPVLSMPSIEAKQQVIIQLQSAQILTLCFKLYKITRVDRRFEDF